MFLWPSFAGQGIVTNTVWHDLRCVERIHFRDYFQNPFRCCSLSTFLRTQLCSGMSLQTTRPFSPKSPLRFCSWNSRAGFGVAAHDSPWKFREKYTELCQLILSNDIVVVLEAHGNRAIVDEFMRLHPDFLACSSLLGRHAGGVVI